MNKILAVDDDLDILYTLSIIGDLAGWNVHTTENPGKALALLETEEYQAIIVDYHMPEIDGLALVRAIRVLDTQVPIIVLTVDDRMVLAERFRQAGASDFALKPIKAPDFISRINVHLGLGKTRLSGGSPLDDLETGLTTPPKGLSVQTMSLIVSLLEDEQLHKQSWLGVDEIAVRAGIAYQTVWRYLDTLEHDGFLTVKLDYGNRGRPRKRYRLNE